MLGNPAYIRACAYLCCPSVDRFFSRLVGCLGCVPQEACRISRSASSIHLSSALLPSGPPSFLQYLATVSHLPHFPVVRVSSKQGRKGRGSTVSFFWQPTGDRTGRDEQSCFDHGRPCTRFGVVSSRCYSVESFGRFFVTRDPGEPLGNPTVYGNLRRDEGVRNGH